MDIREHIRQINDTEGIEKLHVEPWGCDVWLRILTAREADKFQSSLINQKSGKVDMQNTRAKFAVLVCCNEDGTPMFKAGDESWLGNKCAAALGAIYERGTKLNKMEDDAVDDEIKNCETVPADGSCSNSQQDSDAPSEN
jgi:hypothetical protein